MSYEPFRERWARARRINETEGPLVPEEAMPTVMSALLIALVIGVIVGLFIAWLVS